MLNPRIMLTVIGPKHLPWTLAAVVLLAVASTGRALGESFKFTEGLKTKEVCSKPPGVISCDVFQSGSFQLTATYNATDLRYLNNGSFLPGQSDDSTSKESPVMLQFGSINIQGKLGDDPKYKPGQKNSSWNIVVGHPVCDGSGKCKTNADVTVSVKWSKQGVTVTAKGSYDMAKDPASAGPVLAGNYLGAPGKIDDAGPDDYFEFDLGDFNGSGSIRITGKDTVNTSKNGNDLDTVTITGVRD